MDLAKVFDTVNHDILLNKLNNYGIRGIALQLMKNYFTERIQRVKIGNNTSNETMIQTGVPQGTVLGPILFLIYINSISKINDFQGHIVCYADDTALFFDGPSWKEVKSNAESDIKKIHTWLNHNMLSLNIKKTKYITFSPTIRDQPENFTLKLHTPVTLEMAVIVNTLNKHIPLSI